MVIKHYQVPLYERTMEKLKRFTNEETAKGALTSVVSLYLEQVPLYEELKRLSGERTAKDALGAAIKYYIEQHRGRKEKKF